MELQPHLSALFAMLFEPEWSPPPAQLELSERTAHVWRAPLDVPSEQLAALLAFLSNDERRRAGRFVREQDRQRFIAARGYLRVLLSRYLQCPPEQLVFTYNEYGKPALAEVSELNFNLAHREGLVLYAVARQWPLGIDVEALSAEVEIESLWPRIASADEQALWQTLSATQRRRVFFQVWTRKEAVIKALGIGLSFPLGSLTVLDRFSIEGLGDPGYLARMVGQVANLSHHSQPGTPLNTDMGLTADQVLDEATTTLHLHTFSLQPNYLAAVAVAGQLNCEWFVLA